MPDYRVGTGYGYGYGYGYSYVYAGYDYWVHCWQMQFRGKYLENDSALLARGRKIIAKVKSEVQSAKWREGGIGLEARGGAKEGVQIAEFWFSR